MTARLLGFTTILAAAAATACVHQTEAPPLTGPSTVARSLTITATPDHITQDGASQSSVVVQAIGPNGAPLTGIIIRIDTAVDGKLVDFGTLGARTIVTGSDGTARTVFTAPPPLPPPFDTTVNMVGIRAVQLASDAAATIPVVTTIALMPKGIILPPGEPPTAQFLFFPSAPTVGSSVFFDASASCPGQASAGVCAASNSGPIVSYDWRFGDGGTASGITANHAFPIPQTYTVTLTVTNSRGLSAATTQNVTVTDGKPTASFTATVINATNRTISFDGSASSAVTGATIATYQWSFGDGTFSGASTAPTITHSYDVSLSKTTLPVRLTVTDNLGRTASVSQNVAVP